MKNNKGVTLIALAITIIVMLILASITIGSIRDKKGIVKQAETSSAEAEKESIIEKIEADLYNEKIKKGKKPTKSELKQMIEAKGYSDTLAEDSFTSKGGKYTINYDEISGWEDKYIQRNLILHLDAINNVNAGDDKHSNTTTIWKDLSGNGNDVQLNKFNNTLQSGWMENGLKFDGIDDFAKTINDLQLKGAQELTIEFVDLNGEMYKTGEKRLLFETSADSNNNIGAFYIDTNEFGTKEITIAMRWDRLKPGIKLRNFRMDNNVLNANESFSYTITFSSRQNYNNYTNMYKNAIKRQGTSDIREDLSKDVTNLKLENYPMYIGAREGKNSFSKMNLASLRIYNRALTQEEINYNYEIDKARFGI